MFVEGKIKKYNSERGFGFIALEGQADIFFHITDFPKAGGEPKVGELLKFLIVQDKDKFKAANIVRLDLKSSHSSSHFVSNSEISSNAILPNNPQSSSKKRMIVTVIGLMIIAVLAVLVLSKKTEQALKAIPTPAVHHDQKRLEQQPLIAQTQFSCDGRTLCSQMRSRAEAEYFINNCSNTKMDGDNDGIPCENDSRW